MSTLAEHKQLRRSFTVLEELEAGIVLTGAEVKSAKQGAVSFNGAYVTIDQGELWLKHLLISPYLPAKGHDYNPTRPRKLLLHTSEIANLFGKMKTEGLTLLPKKLYTRGGLVKVQLALARGLKTHDKREQLKRRDVQKQIRRRLASSS